MTGMQICNQEIQIKEWNGRRVLTFRDIDRVHERLEGTARKRFTDNRRHFIEGEDYYKISLSEFRTMGIESKSNYPQGLILVTESGYLMLVKSFTDDLAWEVQRQLVNCYFRVTGEVIVVETANLTKLEWVKLGELIVCCPRHSYPALLVVLNNLAPGHFENFVIQPENVMRVRFGLPDDFGEWLSDALKKNNLTQNELAEKTRSSKSSISHYVNGKHKPNESKYQKICEVLNIDINMT
jgi:DNA-binding XRE family transcriptional regulator